ncbi:MAG: TIGR00730 family Rossman fold protein [Rubricoccaceae bacterium]|nr:TIGR00730 family Rossman fold protein [Rubricoccaceae bacterium]
MTDDHDNHSPRETPYSARKKMSADEQAAWQSTRIRDTWRVFRIMGEFVEGFERLVEIGPSVSVFGSARTKPGTPYYEMGREVGRHLVGHGYAVITGGGPGIMEAANRGAQEAGGVSVGLNIVLPHEQYVNPYVDPDKAINFDFFFARKTMFVKYAQGFIVLPGGYGTMDELFESLTLIQTGKTTRFPVVLMGTEFWGGLLGWLREIMLDAGNIAEPDLDLLTVTDDPAEAVEAIERFAQEVGVAPNF